MKLKVFQIYFDEKSKSNCFPEWHHYDNSGKLTAYFENSVIVDLIEKGEHLDADYFAVFSHDIKQHVHFSEYVNDTEKVLFCPQSLLGVMDLYPDIEVFSFQKRRKNENIIYQAEHYHPGFVGHMRTILRETGFMDDIPKKINNIILFNHFIARKEIYEQYVNELLIPAMNVMEGIPDLLNDAGYKEKLSPVLKERFINAFGKPHYPYHPFVCERLPSVFMEKYKYRFKHIF